MQLALAVCLGMTVIHLRVVRSGCAWLTGGCIRATAVSGPCFGYPGVLHKPPVLSTPVR